MTTTASAATDTLSFTRVEKEADFPTWAPRSVIEEFLLVNMKPYNDPPKDITAAIDYAFGKNDKPGGYIMLAHFGDQLAGICVMLNSGMGGFIPKWILLYIGVNPEMRGKGIGGKLMKESIDNCDGDVKLHVEYDNPAKRLYERFGFTTKYAEMRYAR